MLGQRACKRFCAASILRLLALTVAWAVLCMQALIGCRSVHALWRALALCWTVLHPDQREPGYAL